jgi:tetratricopeptide (TPR) repeat protein
MMKIKSVSILLFIILAFAAPALGQTNATAQSESEWFTKAVSLYNQDKFAESLEAYNKVLEINPNNAEAWNNKGIDLGFMGKNEEALDAFYKATSINSTYAEAWYNMGVIYDALGDLDRAIQAYNEATEANPSYTKAWYRKNYDIDYQGFPHSSLYKELSGQS